MMKHIKNILISLFVLLALGFFVYKNNDQSNKIPIRKIEETKRIDNDKIISWKEFQEKVKSENSVVVDLRKPEEIKRGKLFENALEINYFSDDYQKQVSQLDKDKTYLLYCQLGGRTVKSIDIFHENGLDAYCLDGGVDVTKIKKDLAQEKHLPWEIFKNKAQEKDSIVIDIRTADEYNAGILFEEALIDFDYYSSTFEQKIAQLDPTKTYLIYCRSGNRTGKSIPLFEKYGLKVYDLDGGHKATPPGSLKKFK